MQDIHKLIRPDLREFQAYSSARQEELSTCRGLNANESPWDNQWPFNDSILLNRYPEPQPKALSEKMAMFYGVHPNEILITRGSDEGIDLLMRLFCQPQKDRVLILPPTYGMYEICAKLQGAKLCEIPLLRGNSFQIDYECLMRYQFLIRACELSLKLIFICSPNNPTGDLFDESMIFDLCQRCSNNSIIVVDEAYIEYATQKSLTKAINRFKNLVILRTLSKAFGLSGIRCGALIANKNIIKYLAKIIAPYPIPVLTAQIALDALDAKNILTVENRISIIHQERKKMFEFFSQHPEIVNVWPSQANFLLIEAKNPTSLLKTCLNHKIALRNMMNKPYLQNCIRVSIGLPEENNKLIEVLNNHE